MKDQRSGTNRGSGSSSGGAARQAWRMLPPKAKKQIMYGTTFNVGGAGAAIYGIKKAKADTKKLGAEGPKRSTPVKGKKKK